jgi:hypothetical protein
MRDFPIRLDLVKMGVPERTVRVLEKAARIVELVSNQETIDDDLTTTALLAVLTEARVDDLEAAGPYVEQDQTTAWADATGTVSRATFVAYAGQTVSNPPTQAEVQAIDDHVRLLSQRVAGLVNDLRSIGALT